MDQCQLLEFIENMIAQRLPHRQNRPRVNIGKQSTHRSRTPAHYGSILWKWKALGSVQEGHEIVNARCDGRQSSAGGVNTIRTAFPANSER